MAEKVLSYPRFQVGEYRLTLIPTGTITLDGGAMFGVVPKVLWERLIPSDARNCITLALNALLIEYKDEKCLLDCGVGTKLSPKQRDIYGIGEVTPLADFLKPLGLETKDITKLMLTHLHFDHAGGATTFDENGKVVAAFQNAEVIIHKGEWQSANNPEARSKASYLKEDFLPLKDSGHLSLVEGDENEILPGLFLRVTGGHTRYHQILVLDRPEGGFIYWADLIPTSHHLKIPYVMAYDLYPLETMEAKKKLLKETYEKNQRNLFEHDMDVPVCRLEYNHLKHEYLAKEYLSVTKE